MSGIRWGWTYIRHMLFPYYLNTQPSVLVNVEQINSPSESYVCPSLNNKMLDLCVSLVIFYLTLLFLQNRKQTWKGKVSFPRTQISPCDVMTIPGIWVSCCPVQCFYSLHYTFFYLQRTQEIMYLKVLCKIWYLKYKCIVRLFPDWYHSIEITSLIVLIHNPPSGKIFGYQHLRSPMC